MQIKIQGLQEEMLMVADFKVKLEIHNIFTNKAEDQIQEDGGVIINIVNTKVIEYRMRLEM
jgi:hypothetical protein